jgi:S-adenosylmethionine/arginine decarboxylase-like enzyme
MNGKEFGYELILDLHDCDPRVIRSGPKLKEFVVKLCKEIRMKRYGPARVEHFGHANPMTSGYSLFQFIETSSITGHFSELTNTAYLNIFSCRKYSPEKVKAFCKKFFRCSSMENRFLVRQ